MDFNWVMDNINNDLMKMYNLMTYTQNKAAEMGLKCELYGQIYQVKCEIEKSRSLNIAGF